MSSEKPFIRRERRFEVGDLDGFDAIVSRGSDESGSFAELIDLSRTGVKFGLPFCARFDEMLDIKFEFKHSNLKYEGKGRVRHIRNIEEKRWHVGCAIEPPLTEEVISFLAKRTNQERRRYHRVEVDGSGRLVHQGDIEGCAASIINISEGGFCLLADKEHDPGQRVDFRIKNKLGEEENIAARVRWQKKIDGGLRIGCGYANAASYGKLVSCLSIDDAVNTERVSWYVAAAAILAMILPPLYFLLGSNDDQSQSETGVALISTAEDAMESSAEGLDGRDHAVRLPEQARQAPESRSPAKSNSDPVNRNPEKMRTMGPDTSLIDLADHGKNQTAEPLENVASKHEPWDTMISLVPFDIMNESFDMDFGPSAKGDLHEDIPDLSGMRPEHPVSTSVGPTRVELPQPETKVAAGADSQTTKRPETSIPEQRQQGVSTRRNVRKISRTTMRNTPQSISFDKSVSRPEIEQSVVRKRTSSGEYPPEASSRRNTVNRELIVPSEVIRNRLMSDAPDR